MDEGRKPRDGILTTITSALSGLDDTKKNLIESRIAREIILALVNKAGKGRDEIIRVISNEISDMTASVLKESIDRILNDKEINITIQFKDKPGKATSGKKTASKKKSTRTKKKRKT